jgi:hypothetical protein
MDRHRKTWGIKRSIYLAVGVFAVIGAAASFATPMSIDPMLAAALAIVLLAIPLLASDELLDRFNRAFFRPSELLRK